MWCYYILAIILCVVLGHATPTIAAVSLFTTTHTYTLGDDDSRNSARQKCLTEAKRKILEQVGSYLESQSDLLTSARSTTSGNVKSPQTTSEERQQINEQITTLTAGLMRTEVVKEEYGEVNGRLKITLTIKAEVDPADIQKQLAAKRADQGIRKQVTEQAERLRHLEEQLNAVIAQSKVGIQRDTSSEYEQNSMIRTHAFGSDEIAEIRAYANQGDLLAQKLLGSLYQSGNGVPKSAADAVTWFRLAAAQGDASTQAMLGMAYLFGMGVSKDDGEALKWFRLAAEQRDATAQFYLGAMYENGRGVAHDPVAAVRWYRLSAAQGDVGAQMALGVTRDTGIMDAAEAVKWLRLTAAQGDAYAQLLLASHYVQGRGVPKDFTRAYIWYLVAATTGDAKVVNAKYVKTRDLIAAQLTAEQLAQAKATARDCVRQNYKGCE